MIMASEQIIRLYRKRRKPRHIDLRLNRPGAMDLHKATSTIFITDSEKRSIQKYTKEGAFISKFYNDRHMPNPCGLCICNERVYVGQNPDHFIMVFTIDGRFITKFGRMGNKKSEFMHPYHFTSDEVSGMIFVCDMDNNRIQIFTHDGDFVTMFGEQILSKPISIYYSQDEIIVIQNDSEGAMHFFTCDYPFVKSISTHTYIPRAFLLDCHKNLLIADTGHSEIKVINRAGQTIYKVPFSNPNDVLMFDADTFIAIGDNKQSQMILF